MKRTSKALDKKFQFNIVWTTLGYFSYFGFQWLIVMILAKIGTPINVGKYMLAVSISTPIITFFSMNLRTVLASDVKDKNIFKEYFVLRIITSVASLLIIFLYSIFIEPNTQTSIVIILLTIFKLSEGFSDLVFGFFQKKEQMKYIGQSQIIKTIVFSIVLITSYGLFENLSLTLFLLIISSVILLFVYDFNIYKKLSNESLKNNKIDKHKIYQLAHLALPLSFVALIATLIPNIPRYFIKGYLTEYDLGVFSAITYIAIIGGAFIGAIGQVAIPRIAKYYSQKEFNILYKFIGKLMFIGLVVGFLIFLIIYFFGFQILLLLYNDEYAKYSNILLIISFSTIFQFSTMFLGAAIHAIRKYKLQVYNNTLILISILLFSWLLIPEYGIIGAAYALAGGYLVESIGYIIFSFIAFKSKNIINESGVKK